MVLKFIIVDLHNAISISATAHLHQEQQETYTKWCLLDVGWDPKGYKDVMVKKQGINSYQTPQ